MNEAAPQAWSLIDLILALGLGLSVLVGAWRGFVAEAMALAGWAVCYFAAQWFGPAGGAMLPVGQAGSRLNLVAGMVLIFVVAWLVWALISWAVGKIIRATALSAPDRLLGAGFGLLRGVFVALVAVTLVSMTPVAKWSPWQSSRGVAVLQVVLRGIAPILPAQVGKFLPEQS